MKKLVIGILVLVSVLSVGLFISSLKNNSSGGGTTESGSVTTKSVYCDVVFASDIEFDNGINLSVNSDDGYINAVNYETKNKKLYSVIQGTYSYEYVIDGVLGSFKGTFKVTEENIGKKVTYELDTNARNQVYVKIQAPILSKSLVNDYSISIEDNLMFQSLSSNSIFYIHYYRFSEPGVYHCKIESPYYDTIRFTIIVTDEMFSTCNTFATAYYIDKSNVTFTSGILKIYLPDSYNIIEDYSVIEVTITDPNNNVTTLEQTDESIKRVILQSDTDYTICIKRPGFMDITYNFNETFSGGMKSLTVERISYGVYRGYVPSEITVIVNITYGNEKLNGNDLHFSLYGNDGTEYIGRYIGNNSCSVVVSNCYGYLRYSVRYPGTEWKSTYNLFILSGDDRQKGYTKNLVITANETIYLYKRQGTFSITRPMFSGPFTFDMSDLTYNFEILNNNGDFVDSPVYSIYPGYVNGEICSVKCYIGTYRVTISREGYEDIVINFELLDEGYMDEFTVTSNLPDTYEYHDIIDESIVCTANRYDPSPDYFYITESDWIELS